MNTLMRRCPLCDKDDSSAVLKKDGLTLVQCRGCRMVFANPVPPAYVDGSFYEDAGRSFYLTPEKLAGDYSPVRFARELELFRRYCRHGKVLDVGCSTGAFLFQLKARFGDQYDVFGTDVSGPPLDHAASQGIPVIREDFLAHDFGPTQFDAVTFWAVLEHVANPRAFVQKAWGILKPGGACFILVPNFDSLAVRLLKAKYRYILPQHINYFDRASLRRLSCPPFGEQFYASTHFNPMVLVKDAFSRGSIDASERSRLLVRTNSWKQSAWMLPLRWIYGGCEKSLAAANLADNCMLVLRK